MNGAQIKTVLWLRWRLSRNQLTRAGPVGMAFTVVLGVLGTLAVLASASGGFVIGGMAMEHAAPTVHLLLWNGIMMIFLLFWLMGIMVELQRTESINLERFLHLPVSLRQIFLFNFLASHLSPAILIFVPGLLTLALGLTWSRGPLWLLMIPLVLSFLFCLSAWTYCLRGWLASLMANKRRQRTIAVGVTMGFILIAQLPNLYINVIHPREDRHSRSSNGATQTPSLSSNAEETPPPTGGLPFGLVKAQPWIPLFWVGHGALRLSDRVVGPALAYTLLLFLTGTLGIRTAYRGTLRFYTGHQRVRGTPRTEGGRAANWLDWDVPLLPRQVGTLSLMFLRSILRAPEMKMALLTPLIVMVIFGSVILKGPASRQAVLNTMLPATAGFFILFGLIQIASNHFGFDRHGFRALVLLPVRRSDILWAKNLALFPLALGLELLGLAALVAFTHESWPRLTAGFLQFLSGYLLLSMIGNMGSIVAPFRVNPGAMKRSKSAPRSVLTNLAIHLLLPILMLPVMSPMILQVVCDVKQWLPGVPVDLIGSALVLAVCLLVYKLTLPGMGRLLQQREKAILETVTREVD